MPLVSVRDPGPAGGAARTAGGVARAGSGPAVPPAGPGYTGTVPVNTRTSVATPLFTMDNSVNYQDPLLMPIGVNEWLCVIASSDAVTSTDLWWRRVSVHDTTKQITLGAIGTLHYNEPLWLTMMAGNALVLTSPPSGNSYVYFGVFNSTYTSLAIAKHDYASPDWWWTQSLIGGYAGPLPYLSFATNDVAVVGMAPVNAYQDGDGQGALLCLNPHTGAVIDTWRTPVHSSPWMQATLYDAGHAFVMCGDSFAGTVVGAHLVSFGPTGFGTVTTISPPSGPLGWDTLQMNVHGPPYATQFIQNGFLEASYVNAGQLGFSVVGSMVHLYSGTQAGLQPLPAPYAGTVSDPTFAAQPYPSTSPSSWMLFGSHRDFDGNQLNVYDRVASYIDGAGNMQADVVETVSYPQTVVGPTGTISNSPGKGAVDSAGNFLTRIAVPDVSTTEVYLWAGATSTVQIRTRTARLTFTQLIDHNDFAFGSFPGAIWDTDFADYCTWACADLSGGTFVHMQVGTSDLSYANLTGCAFSPSNGSVAFSSCSFAHADCTGSVFNNVEFDHVDFTDAILRDCVFDTCDFRGAGFIGADLTGATFIDCTWGSFRGAGFPDPTVFWDRTTKWPVGFDTTVFPASRSAYYDLSGQHLIGNVYQDAFLAHANFAGAILEDFYFGWGNCAWADFSGAQLLGSTSRNSSIIGNFCLFSWCNFQKATLDFGIPAPFEGDVGWIDGLIAPHADLSDTRFIFPAGVNTSAYENACVIVNSNLAYARFDRTQRPPGKMIVVQECNASHTSWVDADLGPTDRYLASGQIFFAGRNPASAGLWCDTNFSYADLTGVKGGVYRSAQFSNAKLINMHAPYSDFSEALFTYVDATGAVLSQRGLDGTMTDLGQYAGRSQSAVGGDPLPPPQLTISGGGLFFGGEQTLIGVIYVPPSAGEPTSWSITPGSVNGSWETLAVHDNATTGGRGWLGVFQLPVNSNPYGPSPHDQILSSHLTYTFHAVGVDFFVCSLIQWAQSLGFSDLGVSVGDASETVPAVVPAATPPSGQQGCGIVTIIASPTTGNLNPPAYTDTNGNDGILRLMNHFQAGVGAHDPAGCFLASYWGKEPASLTTGPMSAASAADPITGLPGPFGPYVAVTLVSHALNIPALYSHTELPASIDRSWLYPAVTGQTDPNEATFDGHEDFSYQTLDPYAINQSSFMDAFGADMNHCHFLGTAYHFEGYNCNLEGATFEPGFFFDGGAFLSQSYQSHWGGPPSAPRVPAVAVGLPPRASKHGLVVVKSRVG